ncbi:hypothetical protein GLYMA_10G250700v4 [Glycine max]|uniref:FAF domain-containing protein n=1 Tax=Glycine max TaxID=3847 RepID=I1LE76_SOYBN|nr:protein FANTASTIC FOUR 3 [Glycine max]KAG4984331.1 hypothetical protein JHK87_029080 [Glycine soja]KAG5005145.1 hypothetical protein JHK86_029284 [Glycine max]KAH1139997.1 hypothetical protein GYH30_029066 [Glycine max]KAH1230884.1 Protein FANTASTIC FOUR 3 [Glycine max]KRH35565.1 hypothetical protein GLYMA_10G250700v4 [Glycine max]|eukprot:XP_006589601.1 protein FANTASTIC FOUR 3 [Glycine max]
MAAIVHHGLQSHLESQHTESIALKLRLPSSKPPLPQLIDLAFKPSFWDSSSTIKPHSEENNNNKKSTPANPNSWSFREALSNVTKEPSQNQTTYVHPQQKRFSLSLSPKSLQLCTENLGNESGSDSGSDSDENSIDMFSSVNGNSGTREQTQQRQPRQLSTAKKAKTQNFPPPLTTIRGGSESLRVRPHREDGRLVIEVTKVPPSSSCFHAERSHGRLRLCFLTNHTPSFETEAAAEEEDDVEEKEPFVNDKGFENEIGGQVKDTTKEEQEETEDETGEEEEQDEECVACGYVKSDVIIMEKYERLRRCKEGGDHENYEFLNWSEPRLVATS